MKITPVAGTGVPASSNVTLNTSASPSKLAAAKAIAAGMAPEEAATMDASSGAMVPQNIKRIKMKTQLSQNRHEYTEPELEQTQEESPTNDASEQTETTEETRPLSPQFAALAKAKRALQVKEREIAQREEALNSQESKPGSEELIARLKVNPLSVLQEHGVTYDQLTEAILANQSGNLPEIKALEAKFEAKVEELNKQLQTRDAQAEEQVLREIRREAVSLAESAPETYEAIRTAKAYDEVRDLVHRVWKNGWSSKGYEPGHVMSTEEAAQYVENYLVDEAVGFAKLQKVQKQLTPQQAADQQAQTSAPAKQRVLRTLTNRDNAVPSLDRRTRAIMAFNNAQKKG